MKTVINAKIIFESDKHEINPPYPPIEKVLIPFNLGMFGNILRAQAFEIVDIVWSDLMGSMEPVITIRYKEGDKG